MDKIETNKPELEKLFNGNELRRLTKAAKEKDLHKLADWASQFEDQIRQEYENAFQEELGDAIDNFVLAIVYTLHFNENTRFGKKRIKDFTDDLFITIDYFRTGEYSPDEYRKQLNDDGITICNKKEED